MFEEISLRPYQHDIINRIIASVFARRGLTFSLEIARQGGKNEISAFLERSLLYFYKEYPYNIIKCSPTFRPQALISMARLKQRLDETIVAGRWESEQGYIIRLGAARVIFLSAEEGANVVGNTAHLLLEIDESQDVSKDKYNKEFRPMCSSTNATTAHYGTTWDDSTLLEEVKQENLELEVKDGIKRHFRYDWEEIAKYNPDYQAYVEAERQRLGNDHPLFRTQYRLLKVGGGGGFLSGQQRAQMQGEHHRRHHPDELKVTVAGIDIAGEAEEAQDAALRNLKPRQDSTVVTIAELDFSACNNIIRQPRILIVDHYWWTGRRHADVLPQLFDILKHVWNCRRAVVDATGMGEPVCSFLRQALGHRIVPFIFTQKAKSELGFNLLAAVNSGRLKMYRSDGSSEYREFWMEMERARCSYRGNETMNFSVDPHLGHDDFLMSMALVVAAAEQYSPREAKGRVGVG